MRILPLAQASDGAWLDPGTLVFTRFGLRGDNVRRYRGGTMASLWRFAPASGREAVALAFPGEPANRSHPMAWGRRVVFLSDANGLTSVWSSNADGSDLRAHTSAGDHARCRLPALAGLAVA